MLSHKWLGALTSAVAACLLVAASSGGGGGLRHIASAATSAASWVLAGVKMVLSQMEMVWLAIHNWPSRGEGHATAIWTQDDVGNASFKMWSNDFAP